MSDKVKISEFFIQCAASMCVCFLAFHTGLVMAWPSFTTAIFKSNATVLSQPMTSLQISLLGSLPNVGGLLISPFCSYAFNKFGRKKATMIFGLPFVSHTNDLCPKHHIIIIIIMMMMMMMMMMMIISVTSSIPLVLLAVSIAGVGIAGQNVALIYITEISHDAIRGGLAACSATFSYIGNLASYTMGGYLSYTQVVYTNLTLSVVAICLLMLLKESPVYLVMAGKEDEARKAIGFYRRIDLKSKEMEAEISKIKLEIDPRLEKMLDAAVNETEAGSELITSKETVEMPPPVSSWRFFLKSKSSRRALATCLIVMALSIMMGGVVLQVYAEPLFKEAVSSMQPNQCAIFLSLNFMVASIVCLLAIDKFGRKTMCIVTSILSGVCTLLLGTQLQLHWAPHWFTALLIYAYGFVFTSGVSTIPFVLAAEVFLPEVRSFCNSMVMAFVWIFSFLILVVFNPLVENIGLGPVFYLFSCICFIGAVYCQFCLPETKGLAVTDIQKAFLKERRK